LSRKKGNEAATCREYVIPKLKSAAWTGEQILPEFYFTDGRVQIAGGTARRMDVLKREQAASEKELNTLLPAILDRTFRGQL
jgi:hypothetical protein